MQYGFIKGRSTVLQLLRILDEWTEMLEGGQIDVIYTDFWYGTSHKIVKQIL